MSCFWTFLSPSLRFNKFKGWDTNARAQVADGRSQKARIHHTCRRRTAGQVLSAPAGPNPEYLSDNEKTKAGKHLGKC